MTIPANISNDALSALVAEAHGWTEIEPQSDYQIGRKPLASLRSVVPPFATSLDEVLPLAGKEYRLDCYRYEKGKVHAVVYPESGGVFQGVAEEPARAVCLAILSAKGATLEGRS